MPAIARCRSTSASGCSPPIAAAHPECKPTSCACRFPITRWTAQACGFALRNLVELPRFFDELGRVVRPGGRIALLDVGVPRSKVIRWGNNIYFGKVVPKIGGLLSDGAAYRYLPKSVAYLPPPEQMLADLQATGFADAEHINSAAASRNSPCSGFTRSWKRASRQPDRSERDVDLNDIAATMVLLLRLLTASGVAGRGVAAQVPIDDVAPFLTAIGSRRPGRRCATARPRRGPVRPGLCTLRGGRAVDGRGQGCRRSPLVTAIDDALHSISTRRGPTPGSSATVHDRASDTHRPTISPLSPPPATQCATDSWQKPSSPVRYG